MITSEMRPARTLVEAERAVATGGHPAEVEAALRMIEQGGTVVDAVVAAAFTGFVVEPTSCGVGGYGRLAVYLAARDEFVTVDHYVRAPAAARPDTFEIDHARPTRYHNMPRTVGAAAEQGPRAVAVPGAVTGLVEAHALLGRLPLARVLEPAIEAAEAGVPVDWKLTVAIADRFDAIRAEPNAAAWLMPDGHPPSPSAFDGEPRRLDASALAATLKRIAALGAAGFCTGPVAEAIGRAVAGRGGLLDAADLADYRPKLVHERTCEYRGHRYVTASDPVGYEALNILGHFDLGALAPDGVDYYHLMAEAMGCAFADNLAWYGDPEHEKSPVAGLASAGLGAHRAARISMERALARPIAAVDPWPFEAGEPPPARAVGTPTLGRIAGTSQMAVADAGGDMAVLCTSLSSWLGSCVYVPEAGVLLNNSMQNFDPRPGHPNGIRPGKMPIFAVPTLVAARDGRATIGAAGAGGYRITAGVLHAVTRMIDAGLDPRAALDLPRAHCQGGPTFVEDRVPELVRAALAARGHDVRVQSVRPAATLFARVNAIRRDPASGRLQAGAGPAWETAAAGC